MSEQEMMERIKELEQENQTLRTMLNRGSSGHTSAYSAIREAIVAKVAGEIPLDENEWRGKNYKRLKAERKIMSDLKWELRKRTISDFRTEDIEPAQEYIQNYKIDDFYKGQGE